MPVRTEPFPAEALAENRGGHLTGDQATRFRRMVSGRGKSTRGLAVPVGAIGALLLVLSGPATTTVKHHFAGWGFLAAARPGTCSAGWPGRSAAAIRPP
jgi:hypothetical protein